MIVAQIFLCIAVDTEKDHSSCEKRGATLLFREGFRKRSSKYCGTSSGGRGEQRGGETENGFSPSSE